MPGAATATATATTTATTERLWAVVSALTSWPDHLDTFASVRQVGGPDPWAVGSRFEVRQPGLPRAVYEITEWSASSFVWVARSVGVATTARHRVSPLGRGARLDLELEWTGMLAGVVRAVVGGKASRMIQREASTFARVAAGG